MRYVEHHKKNKITTQRKKIYIIITIITLLLVLSTAVLGVRLAKNGLSLKGLLMTGIGQDEADIENLDPFYCLVLGVSEDIGVELTDTIMLCAYYPGEQKVSMLSIPRDTFVGNSTTSADSFDKINALYQKSPEKTLEAVRNLTGIDVRNYVVISNNALRDVVDAIDGVYFDVPMDMNYDDTSQDLHIHLKKGYQLLDGDKAEQLVRFRHNNDGTTYPAEYGTQDIGRMRTQREFLKAAAKQILSGNNILKVDEIINVLFKNVTTNLTINDIIKYIPAATEFNTDNIQSEMLPGEADYIGILSFYIADEDKTNELISSLFELSEEQIEANKEKFAKESGKKTVTTNTTKKTTNTTTKSKNTNTTNTNTSNTRKKNNTVGTGNNTTKPTSPTTPTKEPEPSKDETNNKGENNKPSTGGGTTENPGSGTSTETKPETGTGTGTGTGTEVTE